MLRDTPKILSVCKDGKLMISPECEIDHHSAKYLRDRIDAEMFENFPSLLIIDLSKVDFMDSSGLGLILGRLAKADELGISMRVTGASERVKKIFSLAGVDRVLKIE